MHNSNKSILVEKSFYDNVAKSRADFSSCLNLSNLRLRY